MKNPGDWEPLGCETLQERPCHPASLTATSNYTQPPLADLEPKTPETGEIAGYSVIVEVSLHHTPQPSPNLRQRVVHAPPQGGLHLLQLGEKSLPDSFAQHEELSILPGSPANVRKPQEVERLRLALTPSLSVLSRKPPELEQAGFVWMEFQVKLPQSFPPILEKTFCFRSILKPQHHIVRIPNHNNFTRGSVRTPVLYP
jgi:hypothetical protein